MRTFCVRLCIRLCVRFYYDLYTNFMHGFMVAFSTATRLGLCAHFVLDLCVHFGTICAPEKVVSC